jgi:predicted lipoprotein
MRNAFSLLAGLLLTLVTPAVADTALVVTDHARPGYAAFAKAANDLASVDSCDPEILRPAFHATYDAWLAVSHLHLGPAEEDGRALAILFWPDPKGLGAKAQRALLASDPATLTAEAMAQQSVAARGLSGLERLLYPAEALENACPLIQATADDLARMSRDLVTGWGAFGDLLLAAGQPDNSRFLTPDEATQALFTQLVTGLEFVADRRIGRPLGTFDRPRPDLAEGQASGRSVRNIILSLQALRDLTITLAPDSPKTLAAFDRSLSLATALNLPASANADDRQSWLELEILQQSVRSTREAAIAELGTALGVGLGFNAQDGD